MVFVALVQDERLPPAEFTKTLDSLGVQPDALFRGLGLDLPEALTVGRPIAD
jgi:hypothetical protein